MLQNNINMRDDIVQYDALIVFRYTRETYLIKHLYLS